MQSDKSNEQYVFMAKVKCSDCNTQFSFPSGLSLIILPITPGVLPQRNKLALAVDNVGRGLRSSDGVHVDTPEHPGETPAA